MNKIEKEPLIFTPKDLDKDSNLLPSRIIIPLSMNISVEVLDSNKLEYIFPDSFSDEEILKAEIQIEEKLEEHQQFLSSLKPY